MTPGHVLIPTGESPRYLAFYHCITRLILPPGTQVRWLMSNVPAKAMNESLAQVKAAGGWAWIIGDDHTFAPDIVLRLLARGLDAVLPLCLDRQRFMPTFWIERGGQPHRPELWELPTSGLVSIWGGGDAGLLLSERAIAHSGPPWYPTVRTSVQFGQIDREPSEDVNMTRRLVEAGISVFADLDTSLGHVLPLSLTPTLQGGRWVRSLMSGEQELGKLTERSFS